MGGNIPFSITDLGPNYDDEDFVEKKERKQKEKPGRKNWWFFYLEKDDVKKRKELLTKVFYKGLNNLRIKISETGIKKTNKCLTKTFFFFPSLTKDILSDNT